MARREENAIALISSQYRDALDELKSSYRLGENGRFRTRPKGITGGAASDAYWKSQDVYFNAVERCRDWDRNIPYVAPGVDRLCDSVHGQTGPTLEVTTSDPKLNEEIAAAFYEWADSPDKCDAQGEQDFWGLAWQNMRHTVVDGDQLVFFSEDGKLRLVENHRLKSPRSTKRNIVLGVVANDDFRPISYMVSDSDLGVMQSIQRVADATEYKARDDAGELQVILPKTKKRYSQLRGVPMLAPAADIVGGFDDLQFAKLVQSQIVSCFGFLEKRIPKQSFGAPGEAPGRASDLSAALGERRIEYRADGTAETFEGLSPGRIYRPREGYDIEGFSPNTPNAEFFPHAMMLLTFFAMNLGVPVHALLLNASDVNFSAYRSQMEQAKQGFQRLQQWRHVTFYRPVYRWKLRQFLAGRGETARGFREALRRLGNEFFSHNWHSPAWAYLDPLKDATADLIQVCNPLTSQRRRCAARNLIWSDVSREIVEDNALHVSRAIEAALKINNRFGLTGSDRITWRDVAMTPSSASVSIKVDTANDPTPPNSQPTGNG